MQKQYSYKSTGVRLLVNYYLICVGPFFAENLHRSFLIQLVEMSLNGLNFRCDNNLTLDFFLGLKRVEIHLQGTFP